MQYHKTSRIKSSMHSVTVLDLFVYSKVLFSAKDQGPFVQKSQAEVGPQGPSRWWRLRQGPHSHDRQRCARPPASDGGANSRLKREQTSLTPQTMRKKGAKTISKQFLQSKHKHTT